MIRNNMQRFLIEFSYDGSDYCGYQKQNNKKTIQEEIERALKDINNNKPVKLCSSGRTDKHVHAVSQYAHVDIDINIDCYHLKSALNSKLSDAIYIKNVTIVDNNFHARYMVKSKTYLYKINISSYNPIERKYIYQYNKSLNIKLVSKILKIYKGTHDFKMFTTSDQNKESTIRTIFSTKLLRKKDYLYIYITGNGFLKYQIRYMIGMLISICENKESIDNLKDFLNNKGTSLHKLAPPEGLYLEDVKY